MFLARLGGRGGGGRGGRGGGFAGTAGVVFVIERRGFLVCAGGICEGALVGLSGGGGVAVYGGFLFFASGSSGRGALSADAILKVVLGAVVKRLDRRRTSGESRRGGGRPGGLAP